MTEDVVWASAFDHRYTLIVRTGSYRGDLSIHYGASEGLLGLGGGEVPAQWNFVRFEMGSVQA